MIENPVEIEERIRELDQRMDVQVQEIAKRSTAFTEAECNYQAAYNQALLRIRDAEKHLARNERSTVDEVQARAAVETQTQYREMRFAEAELKSVQAASRIRQSQMDGLRSLYAGVRRLVEAA